MQGQGQEGGGGRKDAGARSGGLGGRRRCRGKDKREEEVGGGRKDAGARSGGLGGRRRCRGKDKREEEVGGGAGARTGERRR